MFTDGPVGDQSSRIVHAYLVRIVAAGVLIHEIRVQRLVGRTRFEDLVDTWLSRNMPESLDLGIQLRRRAIYGRTDVPRGAPNWQ
jgi:predicted solute-binding protein